MSNSQQNPLPHETAARDLFQFLQATVLQAMPDLKILPPAERRRYNSIKSVPDEFLETIAVTVEETPEAGALVRLTAAQVRDVIIFSRVYSAFADQLEQLLLAIRVTISARRYDIVQRALGVYASAKGVNRRNLTQYVPNLPTMRRTLGRSGRRKQEVPPATETK